MTSAPSGDAPIDPNSDHAAAKGGPAAPTPGENAVPGSAREGGPLPALVGRHLWFTGRLGGVTRREAFALVRQHGGVPHETFDPRQVNMVVIGADELPFDEHDELLPAEARRAETEGRLEVLAETTLWQRLGMVEAESQVRRLYTPAMLADLLRVSVATIRRWRRRGLIVPVKEVHRLPYFDFQEVATARRIAELVAAGASPAAIERKLAALARYVPNVQRPLAQLSVIVEGRQLLLRRGEGLVEPSGQRRIDFDALEADERSPAAVPLEWLDAPLARESSRHSSSGSISRSISGSIGGAPGGKDGESDGGSDGETDGESNEDQHPSGYDLLQMAGEAEDEERWEEAVELYRAALASDGPRAEICFQLAELLYRLGDLPGARERYYMAIELDEDYVEARANLGCLLAELGQLPLAIAAFEGALRFHDDYPDAHYHMACTLDEMSRQVDAEPHWRRFLELSPDSPWSDEARHRLGIAAPDRQFDHDVHTPLDTHKDTPLDHDAHTPLDAP